MDRTLTYTVGDLASDEAIRLRCDCRVRTFGEPNWPGWSAATPDCTSSGSIGNSGAGRAANRLSLGGSCLRSRADYKSLSLGASLEFGELAGCHPAVQRQVQVAGQLYRLVP